MRIKADNSKGNTERQNIMIIGAGAAGLVLLREYRNSYYLTDKVKIFIDDNAQKWNKYLDGVLIEGGRDKILESVEKYEKLRKAQEDAIKELNDAGIKEDLYLEKIRKAKTIEEVEKIKEELLKLNEQKPDEQTPQNPSNPQNPDDSSNPKDSSKNPKEKNNSNKDDDNKAQRKSKKTIKNEYSKQSNNVKTGVASSTGAILALLGSAVGLFKSKKRK